MAATYRYIFADLLTNTVLMELPLQGVTFGRILNGPGDFQGTFHLNSGTYSNQDILDATAPGRTAYYIERNGGLICGGVIWSRTYQEQSWSLQMTGQTFESFLYREDIRHSLIYFNTDQRNILIDLINKMQLYPYRNIGIITPSNFSPNHVVRTVTFNDYEVWDFGKAVEYMVQFDQGFDYTIDVAYDTNGNPSKILNTNDVLGTPAATTQLAFDFPGNIKNFWVPENGAKGVTTISGVGAGEGSAMIRDVQTYQQLLDAGYPELVGIYTNKDVSILNTLANQIKATLNQLRVPVSVNTYELNPTIPPFLGDYQLGDYARFHLESPRYPAGADFSARVIGWTVTPPSSETTEQVKLIIANEDDSI